MKDDFNLDNLENFAKRELKTLKKYVFKLPLYVAGKNKNKKGGFNFYARDLILSSILLDDMVLLKNSLKLCAILQGKKKNPYNGEELGKIFHEYPEKTKTEKNGVNSGFNASDTTSLFIIGLEYYVKKTKDIGFLEEYKENLFLGIKYVLNHIKKGIFWESPSFCSATKFRLNSTYWKDTGFLGRIDNSPIYPVAYSLLQAQVISSLRSAYRLLLFLKVKRLFLLKLAKKMNSKLWSCFWDKKSKNFAIGIDSLGLIRSNSSDYLHLLYYLDKKDIVKRKLKKLLVKTVELRTKYGYRGAIEDRKEDEYYGAIWPWEQAFIFLAGFKHNIRSIMKNSLSSISAILELNCFPEVIRYFKDKLEVKEYNTQLWTIAYVIFIFDFFKNKSKLSMIKSI